MLKEKVAIITGGSRGIGKAIAQAFLQQGARVVIAARTEPEIDRSVKELSRLGQVIGLPTDVAKKEDVQNLIEETLKEYGSIDILVAAAAIQTPIGPLVEAETDAWIHNIQVNLIGTVLCSKAVLPSMIAQKKGKIVTFSGGGGTSPRPNFSAYACSKAAVVRFTETLALEVREHGIDVNTIAPGSVNTGMLDEIIKAGRKSGDKELNEALERERKGGTSPRLAADLAVFLASEESDGITGRLISAVWDDWKGLKDDPGRITGSSLYTLRRIDGQKFFEGK
jgi:NAD(P)-dependent dehydrogenase (short-subunit alcohol dehydrogenase family)